MRSSKTLAFLIFALILLSGINAIFAASTWTGNNSTDWGNKNNWSGPRPKSNTSDLDIIIPTSPSGGRYPVLSSGTYSIKFLTIEPGASLTQTGGFLTLNDNLIIQSGSPSGEYSQSDGTLQLKKAWKNEGIFNSTGGTVRFSPIADGGTFEGSNQFFNIEIDDGVEPDFDNADNNNILIAGKFVNNNPDLSITYKATFTFNGTGDQTIYSASTPLPGTTTFGNFVIDKPSGTIQLLSDVAVENTFTEENGSLDKNGYILWVGGTPNPVELSSFSAVILENGIKLKWRTETEVNNYGFDILRQAQDDEWVSLSFVEGHGNSNSPKDYNFVDEYATDGKYYYRLKQIDTDGKFEYSKIIEINLGSPNIYELSQNYPNPFNPSTTIRFSVQESSFINLSIYNSLGEKIEELVNEVKEPGMHTVEFYAESTTGGLSSGTYFYTIKSNNYTNTKKMMLVK
jgi:hypothetical protein